MNGLFSGLPCQYKLFHFDNQFQIGQPTLHSPLQRLQINPASILCILPFNLAGLNIYQSLMLCVGVGY